MDVNYINPFISSTIATYKNMLACDAVPGAPSLKNAPYPTYDITGNIGLSGTAQGIVAMSYSEKSALDTIGKMLGFEISANGPEVVDGIGEIVNIVAGFAKKDLTQYDLTISLPNVVIGKDVVVVAPTGIKTIIVPFECEIGNFTIEVALRTG